MSNHEHEQVQAPTDETMLEMNAKFDQSIKLPPLEPNNSQRLSHMWELLLQLQGVTIELHNIAESINTSEDIRVYNAAAIAVQVLAAHLITGITRLNDAAAHTNRFTLGPAQLLTAGAATMRVDGTRLLDLCTDTNDPRLTSIQIQSYIIEAYSVLLSDPEETIRMSAKDNRAVVDYHQVAAFKLQELSQGLPYLLEMLSTDQGMAKLQLLLDGCEQQSSKEIQNQGYKHIYLPRLKGEFSHLLQPLRRRTLAMRDTFQQALVNPNHQLATSVRTAMLHYLETDKPDRLSRVAHSIGVHTGAYAQLLFRQIQPLCNHPEFGDFYRRLSHAIRFCAETLPDEDKLLPSTYVPILLTIEAAQAAPSTADALAWLSQQLHDQGGTGKREITPAMLSASETAIWSNLRLQPSQIIIEYRDPSKPQQCELSLTFEIPGSDRKLTYRLRTVTNKKRPAQVEWNILEEPGTEGHNGALRQLFNVSMTIFDKILTATIAQAKTQKQALTTTAPPVAQSTTAKQTDRLSPQKKSDTPKQQHGKPKSPTMPPPTRPRQQEAIRRTHHLIEDFEPALAKCKFSPQEMVAIRNTIQTFNTTNERGIKGITESNGELLSLRVRRCSTHIRIILREDIDKESGNKRYVIVEIGYRNSVYNRLK